MMKISAKKLILLATLLVANLAMSAPVAKVDKRLSYDENCEKTYVGLGQPEQRDSIPEGAQLVVAANRLPYSVSNTEGEWSTSVSAGGLVSALKSTTSAEPFDWVGWPGTAIGVKDLEKVNKALNNGDKKFNLSPVLISNEEKKAYYDEFSNRQLWPIFHDMTDKVPAEVVGWDTYRSVNKKFAEALFEKAKKILKDSNGTKKPLLWVQDYQLMLVPQYLREMLEKEGIADKVKIGFFLHIPFPSPESFEKLPADIRLELIKGLTASDEVAFHSKAYSKSFIATIDKVDPSLNPNSNVTSIRGHTMVVKEHPIGINPETYRAALQTEAAQKMVTSLREKYNGYKILLGVERLDPIKGIPEKLRAFERFLEKNQNYQGKVVLIQVAQLSRTDLPEYIRLKAEIDLLTERINTRFTLPGKLSPVQLNQKGFGIEDLSAHYSVADTTIVTSLKDGMNLVAFEASALQKDVAVPGNLILSQETGGAEWLSGALKIDPRNIEQISDTIKEALEMNPAERVRRANENLEHVEHNTANDWVADSLYSLKNGEKSK